METQSDVIFGQKGPGGLALGIPLIMEKIVSYLDDRDLGQWYESSKIFRHIIEQMDDSCWRRRTQTLAKSLRRKTPLEEQFPDKSFREIFPILKTEVESLVSLIRGPDDDRCHWSSGGHSLEETTAASSLAYYGQFGSVGYMDLRHYDLTHVPDEHLCSLASSVTVRFGIKAVTGCDLIRIIESVKSEWFYIHEQDIDKEVCEAVVRAMDTRIDRVELEYRMLWNREVSLDTGALTQYSGRGRCRKVEVWAGRSDKYRQWLRDWARDRDWSVTKDDEILLTVERKSVSQLPKTGLVKHV